MWALVDNYDSFTHILLHYLRQLHKDIRVFKNDEGAVTDIALLQPSAVIISPGPGRPSGAGFTMDLIRHFIGHIPILGICLGHQALGEFLGARLVHAPYPMHGKQSRIHITAGAGIFDLPSSMTVMRYHSLVLEDYQHISGFVPLALADDDQALMMFYHPGYACMGIQFHPESVGTEQGMLYLRCWYEWAFKDKTLKEE